MEAVAEGGVAAQRIRWIHEDLDTALSPKGHSAFADDVADGGFGGREQSASVRCRRLLPRFSIRIPGRVLGRRF